MSKTWTEVEENPEFQSLTPNRQWEVKKKYYDQVINVRPDYQELPRERKIEIRSKFFSEGLQSYNKPQPKAIVQPRKNLIDAMAGQAPVETAQMGYPKIAALQAGAKDLLTIPAHYVNMYGFNWPRKLTESAGYEYPVKAEDPIIQKAAYGAGVFGMLKNPLGKKGVAVTTAKNMGLGGKIIKGATVGAKYGVVTAPDLDRDLTGGDILKQKAKDIGVGAGIGAGIPVAGALAKLPSKAVSFVRKSIGGVTDATVNTIKRLGANKVFDPIKASASYIGEVIAPKVQKRITSMIATGQKGVDRILAKLGVPTEEAKIVSNLSPQNRKVLSNILQNPQADTEKILNQVKQKAQSQYREALKTIPDDFKINHYSTIRKLETELQGMGWIDVDGTPLKTTGVPNRFRDNMVKLYNYLRVNQKSGLDKKQFDAVLNDFESSITGNNKFDRIVYQTQVNLKNALERSLDKERALLARTVPNSTAKILSIKQANKEYSDAMNLLQLNKTFNKISESNFPQFVQNKLNALGDPKKFQEHKNWIDIIGKDLLDDLDAHFANRDFGFTSDIPGAGGGIYPSRAGLLRAGISDISRGYYKNVSPFVEGAKGIYNKATGGGIVPAIQRMQNQPAFSPSKSVKRLGK